jgi:uncharacterized membrane protein YoaK (UPF0700 family)
MNKPTNRSTTCDITETLFFCVLLSFVGGIMDVYSYLVHGNVFATGQTGNLILSVIHLTEGNLLQSLYPLIPISAFWVGNYFAWQIYHNHFKDKPFHWKRTVLFIESIILLLTGFIPSSYPNVIANLLVSFAASLQFCAFRTFHDTENYASVFCTGNMRSCADHFYKGFALGDRQSLKLALQYGFIILAFAGGALIGALTSKLLQEKAIWTASIFLSVVLAFTFLSQSPFTRFRLSKSSL